MNISKKIPSVLILFSGIFLFAFSFSDAQLIPVTAQEFRQAPDYQAITLDGTPVSISDYRGKVILVNLWATWCKPCVAEFESLEKFKKKVIGKKIKIVAISNENKDKIKAFIEKRNFDLEFIKLNGDLTYFNAYSLPTTIILDKKGNESFRIASGIDFTSNNFVDKILALEEL